MEITKALLAAQKEFKPIPRTGKNPHFGSTYATLDDILSSVLPILHANGLYLSQYPVDLDGRVGVRTEVVHAESGEKIESCFTLNLSKNDAQGAGSAITYARRYAIQAMLGLNVEDDDDGNKASEAPKSRIVRRVQNLTSPEVREELEKTDPLADQND